MWDTYIDHYYPGWLLLNRLAQSYDALMVALDHDRRDLLGEFAYFKDPNLAGPAPVDEDPRDDTRDAAVREHIASVVSDGAPLPDARADRADGQESLWAHSVLRRRRRDFRSRQRSRSFICREDGADRHGARARLRIRGRR